MNETYLWVALQVRVRVAICVTVMVTVKWSCLWVSVRVTVGVRVTVTVMVMGTEGSLFLGLLCRLLYKGIKVTRHSGQGGVSCFELRIGAGVGLWVQARVRVRVWDYFLTPHHIPLQVWIGVQDRSLYRYG